MKLEKFQNLSEEQLKNAHLNVPAVFSETRDVSVTERSAVFKINTVGLDTFNSIVSPRGLDISYHDKFNVVKRGHGAEVGKALWKKMNPDKTEWTSKVQFANTLAADETFQLIQGDILRGASVGLISIMRQYFFQEAATEFEKEYADLGLKAPTGLQWFIAQSLLGEWSVVGSPSLPDAEIQRSIEGMSEETQMFVMNAYYAERFPKLIADVEALRSAAATSGQIDGRIEKMIDEKCQAIFNEMTKRGDGEKPLADKAGDGAKPSGAVISEKMAIKYLETRAKEIMEDRIDYLLGKKI